MTLLVRGIQLNAHPFYVEKPYVYASATLKIAEISRNRLFFGRQKYPHYLQAIDNIFNLFMTLSKNVST